MAKNTQGPDLDKPATHSQPSPLIISYITLRRIVGIIAIALAFILRLGIIAFHHKVPYSISSYYYSPMRNVLVGSLCILGMFLIAYKGHDKLETRTTNIAGIGAIGVAFFPTSDPSFSPAWVGSLHPFFAAVAMGSLALMALQFTHTKPLKEKLDWRQEIRYMGLTLLFRYEDPIDREHKPNKNLRNHIYSSCAWVILIAVVLAFVQNFWPKSAKDLTQWLFWFEAIAIIAFGFSWLVKGKTIFKDPAPLVAPSAVEGPLDRPSRSSS